MTLKTQKRLRGEGQPLSTWTRSVATRTNRRNPGASCVSAKGFLRLQTDAVGAGGAESACRSIAVRLLPHLNMKNQNPLKHSFCCTSSAPQRGAPLCSRRASGPLGHPCPHARRGCPQKTSAAGDGRAKEMGRHGCPHHHVAEGLAPAGWERRLARGCGSASLPQAWPGRGQR